MASCFGYSSSEDEDGLDSVIAALYAEVIARVECGAHRVIFQQQQLPEQSPTARSTALPVAELEEELGESFEQWDEESDDEEEVKNILRTIYGAVDQEGGRMLAEEAPRA